MTTSDPRRGTGLLTIPNVLSGIRLVGVVPLLWLASRGETGPFTGLMIVLIMTDWVDGKLAIRLDQRTELGARLDSAADAAMYGAIAVSFWWLVPAVIAKHRVWIVAAVGTWVASAIIGLVRSGRFPSYHTRAAKIGWLLAAAVTIPTVWTGRGVGVPWALAWVTLTNLEACAIGLLLPESRSNVVWIGEALRLRREQAR